MQQQRTATVAQQPKYGPNSNHPSSVQERTRLAQMFARDQSERDHEAERQKALRDHDIAVRDAMRRQVNPPPIAIPDKPSRVRPEHVRDREFSVSVSSKRGFRVRETKDEHPLRVAYDKHKITDAQFAAGDDYRLAYAKINPPGRDCLSERVTSSRETTRLLTAEAVADAAQFVRNAERRLSRANRVIIKYFCGKGWSMIEAIREARIPFHEDGVVDRIREALDELGGVRRRAKAA